MIHDSFYFKAEFFAANLAASWKIKIYFAWKYDKNVRNGLGNNDNKVNDTYRKM